MHHRQCTHIQEDHKTTLVVTIDSLKDFEWVRPQTTEHPHTVPALLRRDLRDLNLGSTGE